MKEIDKGKIIRGRLTDSESSPLKTYIALTVGPEAGFFYFLRYEFLTFLFGSLSGGLGFFLRKRFYRRLFRSSGRSLIIGRNISLRHTLKMTLGNNVTIDDYSLLDARGAGERGFVLEDNVIIGRNCMVVAKDGHIHFGKRTSIGSNTVIVSLAGVIFGERVLVAGGCSFSAGAYHFEDLSRAIMDQGAYSKGPILVGDNAWIGTGAIILDAVKIGKNAIVAAGAVVTEDVPENAIVAGIPAKIVRYRS